MILQMKVRSYAHCLGENSKVGFSTFILNLKLLLWRERKQRTNVKYKIAWRQNSTAKERGRHESVATDST